MSRNAAVRPQRSFRRTIIAAAIAAMGVSSAHAQVTWTDSTGFWDVAGNWSTAALPGAADDVTINVAGTQTVTVRSPDNFTINSLSILGDEILSLTGGSLTVSNGYTSNGSTVLGSSASLVLNGASTLASFTQSGGSLSGTGTVIINGPVNITFGDQRGGGTTILTGTTTIGSSGLLLDSGRTLQNSSTGTLTWNGGTINLNSNVNGSSITGSGTINNAGTFTAVGSATMNATNFGAGDSGAAAAFNNQSGATFQKQGSGTITTVNVAFNNSGLVDVQSGTLSLGGGGTDTGNFTGGAGTLVFSGGTHAVSGAISTQNVTVSAGSMTSTGNYNVAGTTTVSGGTADLSGATVANLGGALVVSSGGILNLGASGASVGSLNQSGGSITGGGTLTVNGPATITFGDHHGTGTTVLTGATTISSSGFLLDAGRVLQNNASGTVTWTAGTINLNSNVNGTSLPGFGTINNAGTFTAVGSATMNAANFGVGDNGAGAAFNNQSGATFQKQNSGTTASITNITVVFNNSGTVDVQSGTLSLNNGGSDTGNFTGAAGTLVFGGGTHSVSGSISTQNVTVSAGAMTSTGAYNVAGTTTVAGGSADLSGASLANLGGALVVSGGTLNLGGSGAAVASLNQSSGSIAGGGTLTVNGPATITFGDHQGAGTTVLTGATTISSSGFLLDAGRTLQNGASGTLTWSGGTINLNSNVNSTSLAGFGTINNAGTFTAVGSATMNASNFGPTDNGSGAAFNNQSGATFRKQNSGTTASTTNMNVVFNSAGSVDVESGTLSLNNGGVDTGNFTGAAGTLVFGGGAHTVTGSISTQNVTVSAGAMTSTGAYNVAGTTTVSGGSADLSGATVANLGGALVVSGGSLNLGASGATVASLTQSGGSIAGAGTLTVNGPASITFGDHHGTGTTVLTGPSTISASGFLLDAGRVLQNSSTGTLTWSGGTINLNSNVNSTSIAGFGTINNAGTFTAVGSATMNTANFGPSDNGVGAAFNNQSGATFQKQNSGLTPSTTNISVAFNNSGTVDVQSGTLSLNNGGADTGNFMGAAGTLVFGGGTHTASGTISTQNVTVSAGTMTNTGTYNVAGITTVSGGTSDLSGATLTNLGSALVVSGGILNLGANGATVGSLGQSNGSIAGSGTLTVNGPATITFGDHQGTGTTVLTGATTISSSGFDLDAGRTLQNSSTGTLTWTGGTLNLNANASSTSIAGFGTINNAGTFTAIGPASVVVSNFGGSDTGAGAAFNNNSGGTFRRQNNGPTASTTNMTVAFNNSGVVDVQSGTLSLTNGGTDTGSFVGSGTLQFSGGTHTFGPGGSVTTQNVTLATGTVDLTGATMSTFGNALTISGGSLVLGGNNVSVGSLTQGSGSIAGTGTFTVNGPANITFGDHRGTGTTVLAGASTISSSGFELDAGRVLQNSPAGTLTWSGGTINLNSNINGSSLPGFGTINNAGTFVATGSSTMNASNFGGTDTGAGATFNNSGSFQKQGSTTTSINVALSNSGTVDVQGGVLSLGQGTQGSGTVQTGGGAQLVVLAPSTTGVLINNGTVNLGANTITVSGDYNNANFGSGDSFNRRANITVTGTGNRLIAAGDVNQGIGGTGVTGGTSATPTLTLGNVHIGTNTYSYDIQNVGTSGPGLRGAIQTGVNGASITDSRLSGSGVTAGNWGITLAGNTVTQVVNFTVSSAGTYAPLSGQKVNIVNNFDNTRSQLLSINSAAGAAAYRYAQPTINTPSIDLVSRVGGLTSAAVSVSNSAPADGFSEGLNASLGTAPGGFNTSGSFTNLPAGGTNPGSLQVALNTASSGTFSGSVPVNFVSNGTVSGLADTPLPSGSVNVSGKVYAPAVAQVNTPSVDFGIVHVGDMVGSRNISVSNAASGALTDTLNGNVSSTSAPFVGAGTFSGLAAGGTDTSSLSLNLNTSTAGVFSGNANLAFASHNPDMADLTLPGAMVGLNAQVNNFANGAFTKQSGAGTFTRLGSTFTLNFGTVTQGSVNLSSLLSVLNDVVGPADLLNGMFTLPAVQHFSFTGFDNFADIGAGQAFDGLGVGFDTSTAGVFDDLVQLDLIGHNASGYSGSLGSIYLDVMGEVTPTAAIPEPQTYAMLFAGLGLLGFAARRRRRLHQC